ncbi:winged helix-turn-helix transcriptional regulator [Phytoactinopolyspora endophytica]|uniref:winged helix-turn-helix transcriptional regulator n=1 Tax=Phytoactinopolyspora endophytica TaxID=1642495 RepID=UPI00101DBE46|nr:winged helix-turn-helix transcriptional regulator [Phytoactinopolyspora endophytica]
MSPGDPRFIRALYLAQNLFAGKWMIAISVVLLAGPLHYTDILHRVRELDVDVDRSGRRSVLHEAVLTRTLQRMVHDGLLSRDERPSAFAPSVVYALTPVATEALTAAVPVAEWAETYVEQACPNGATTPTSGSHLNGTPTPTPPLVSQYGIT